MYISRLMTNYSGVSPRIGGRTDEHNNTTFHAQCPPGRWVGATGPDVSTEHGAGGIERRIETIGGRVGKNKHER